MIGSEGPRSRSMWSLTYRRTSGFPSSVAAHLGVMLEVLEGSRFGCCPLKQVRHAAMANSPRTGAHFGPFQLAGSGMGADRTDVDGGGAQLADVGQ
jgi:hypothetical protein